MIFGWNLMKFGWNLGWNWWYIHVCSYTWGVIHGVYIIVVDDFDDIWMIINEIDDKSLIVWW